MPTRGFKTSCSKPKVENLPKEHSSNIDKKSEVNEFARAEEK